MLTWTEAPSPREKTWLLISAIAIGAPTRKPKAAEVVLPTIPALEKNGLIAERHRTEVVKDDGHDPIFYSLGMLGFEGSFANETPCSSRW